MGLSRRYFNDDTIAAIATAPNARAAIGIVRVSGEKTWQACQKILRPIEGGAWKSIESHKLYRCHVLAGETIIDDALFVWMKAPHSFTGEDVIEIHQHGNPRLLQATMEALTKAGARVAHPGEFSFRAFQNGKLDLSQAEAIMDLIASESPAKSEQALHSLLGSTKNFVAEKKQELLQALAAVEVDIDFSDQGLSQLDYQGWAKNLEDWCSDIERVRERFRVSQPLRDGIRMAIIGAPNSGKSTLFNRLLGEDRSIVTDIAGTTRDVVRERFTLDGLLFQLADTAGLRETSDRVEAEGIERSFGELRGADLILLVVDAGSPSSYPEWVRRAKAENPSAALILVFNKIDLARANSSDKEAVYLSAKTGEGFDTLRSAIRQKFASLEPEATSEGFAIGRTRHSELLGKAAEQVREAIQKVRQGELLPDLLASDLRAAMSALGEITGEVNTDDVLNFIFAEFCIGK